MESSTIYLLIADLILLLHVLFVVFVVLGLALIFSGYVLAWSWVRNPLFRLIHLAAIAVVVVQTWLHMICPLTTIEIDLRARAGDTVYSGSFISHWLETILYYQAPQWAFIATYTAFGILVVTAWFVVRPRRFRSKDVSGKKDSFL